MRCEAHLAEAAVGVCSTCGRGVCAECKVRFEGRLQCKSCVESGRVTAKVAPAVQAPVPVVVPPPPQPAWPPVSGPEVAFAFVLACIPLVGIVTGACYALALSPHRRRLGAALLAVGAISLVIGIGLLYLFWPRYYLEGA